MKMENWPVTQAQVMFSECCYHVLSGTSLLIQTATEQSSASYYGEQGLHYVDVKGESCLVPRGM